MTPIISPWIFYVINLLTNLSIICFIIVAVLAVTIMFTIIGAGIEDNDISTILKKMKPLYIIVLICILFTVAIPSESTMYKMLVAQNVTSDNLNAATDIIKNGVDYIFDKLDGDKTEK